MSKETGGRDQLLRGSVGLTAYTLASAVMGFSYWVLVARLYGAGDVGAAGAVVGVAPLLAMAAALGMPETVIRTLPGSSNRVRVWRDATFLALAAAIAIAATWSLLGRDSIVFEQVEGSWHLAGILIAMVGANAVSSVAVAAAISARRSIWLVAEAIGGGAVRLVATAVLAGRGLDGLLSGYTIGSWAAAIISVGVAWAAVHEGGRGTDGEGLSLGQWRYATSNWIAGLVSMLPKSLAAGVVAWSSGTEEAAWVAVPLLILNVITVIPSAVARSLFAEGARDAEMRRQLVARAARLAGGATACVAGVVAVSAPLVLQVFGDAYRENSTGTLRLFAVAAVVAVPNYLLDAILNLRPRRRAFVITNLAGTAVVLASIVVLTGPIGLGGAWIAGQAGYFAAGMAAWAADRPRTEKRG